MKTSQKLTLSLFQQDLLSLVIRRIEHHFSFLVLSYLITTAAIAFGPNKLLAFTPKSAAIGIVFNNQDEEAELLNKDTTIQLTGNNIEQIVAESEELWFNDKEQSEQLILSTFEILKHQKVNDSLQARMYHLYGKLLVDKRETRAGTETLLKCIEIKKKVFGDNQPELANTYNYLGIAYFHLRQYEEAMAYYKMAADILNQNHQINRSLYDATLNMGIVSAVRGEYDFSFNYFNKALFVLDSLGSSVDSVLIARFYLNYGLMTTLMGKFDDAIQYYSIAESIYKKKFGPDYLSIATISTNKGINAFYTYDYTRAKLYYKEALNVFFKNNDSGLDVAGIYNNLSAVSIETGAFTKSIAYCFLGLKYNPDDYIKLLLFQNLAESYAALGKTDSADHYYLSAINLLRSGQINPTKSISLYKSYADFLFDTGHLKKSEKYYFIALAKTKLFDRSGSEVYASLLSQIGDYYRLSESSIDSALLFYEQSILTWKAIQNNKDIEQNGNFDDIRFLDAYLGKAKALSSLYQKEHRLDLLKESYEIFKWALVKATTITRNLNRENQLLFNEKLDGAFDEAINIASAMYIKTSEIQYKEVAFEFAEQSKSSVLLAAVQNNYALKTTGIPKQFIQSEQQLHQEINGMKKLLSDEQIKKYPSQKKVSFFNSRLLQLMCSYDSLVNQIEQNYPKYFALKYDRSVIKMSALNKHIADDEALIEYVLTDSVLTLFCLGKDINYFSQIRIDSVFNNALNQLILLKNTDLSHHNKQVMKDFVWNASVLWEYLIAPIYSKIQGKRLIIVPDGRLGYLSFDLLLQPSAIPEKPNYRLLPYLIKEFPISYSYSSSLRYNSYFQTKETPLRGMIAFAPENKEQKLSGLNRLLNSGKEVTAIEHLFNGRAYLGEQATKSRFLSEATNYEIIHLAMHTVINDSLPMFSELLFYDDGIQNTDTKLHTYEVFGLKLKADLVVLSACNTGSGRLQKGEGIMSLARGFIYAGAPSIVLTLWEAQDKATSEIMQGFYSKLKSGATKDVALQQAKLHFLANANQLKSHPYYWSSFIISGNAKQLPQSDKINWSERLIYSGLILLILIIGFAFYRKRKSVKEMH